MFVMGETIWGCHHHIINARLASGPATPFLMKLPFPEGGLNYGIFWPYEYLTPLYGDTKPFHV
jgi:hypothetical protein